MAAKGRRRRPNQSPPLEWGTLALRAVLIVVDWLVNGNGLK
ncbi:hypothetical protein AB0K21_42380 [Streptosporangium sp. NPDC049248]